ncbi:MAG: protein-glutamate O-methyltransferase CheR [Desulfarculus sp.]|nr:protein-glutamate O-methyltransferase CheR [Desulfarculus sp.]
MGEGSEADSARQQEVEAVEVRLLLEGIRSLYGYDFRDYAPASLGRRLRKILEEEGLPSLSRLLEMILHDPAQMGRFLIALAVPTTAMFRDPGFFLALRQKAVPLLKDLPFFRVWHAGCSTGEEVYSLAILLEEEGLLPKARRYATDLSQEVIDKAKEGIFAAKAMQAYTNNYARSGGHGSFSHYYTAKHDLAIMRPDLAREVVWATHNLVSDGSFNEFNLILCRNVMIYFNPKLQERVHHLLYDSLAMGGVLGLGRGESLLGSPHADCYRALDVSEKIFVKVK